MKSSSNKRDSATLTRDADSVRHINARLEQIYSDVAELDQMHGRLTGLGFVADKLPVPVDRQAYCLLGEHQRPETLTRIAHSETELREKAIINRPLAQLSTPMLRLLSVIVPDLDRVLALRERIEEGLASAISENRYDFAILLPEQLISALEAQTVQVTGLAKGCEWLLIRPEPVFGVRESLLESKGQNEFEIEMPCASGQIEIIGINAQGHVLRRTLRMQAILPWSDIPQQTTWATR
nr:hypothetical protein [uncultured Undibacterium sp.]